jgi:hypothetical protein
MRRTLSGWQQDSARCILHLRPQNVKDAPNVGGQDKPTPSMATCAGQPNGRAWLAMQEESKMTYLGGWFDGVAQEGILNPGGRQF